MRFLACLKCHCVDRALEKEGGTEHAKAMYLGGKPAAYWVCGDCRRFAAAQPLTQLCLVSCAAYANNQHKLDELAAELDQTPFARAMKMSKGHHRIHRTAWPWPCCGFMDAYRQEPCPFSTQTVSAGPASGGESALPVFASRHSAHRPLQRLRAVHLAGKFQSRLHLRHVHCSGA